LIELTNPYAANNVDYIYTVEGLFDGESDGYSPPKKVVINFYNGVYTGYRLEGFNTSDIPEPEDILELQAEIKNKVDELRGQQ